MPAFDTLKAMKLLKESGFEETQAEAVVATVRDAVSESVATKADIAELRNGLKADMIELRNELKADIAEIRTGMLQLRSDTYRLALVLSAGIVGLTVSLIKLLP